MALYFVALVIPAEKNNIAARSLISSSPIFFEWAGHSVSASLLGQFLCDSLGLEVLTAEIASSIGCGKSEGRGNTGKFIVYILKGIGRLSKSRLCLWVIRLISECLVAS